MAEPESPERHNFTWQLEDNLDLSGDKAFSDPSQMSNVTDTNGSRHPKVTLHLALKSARGYELSAYLEPRKAKFTAFVETRVFLARNGRRLNLEFSDERFFSSSEKLFFTYKLDNVVDKISKKSPSLIITVALCFNSTTVTGGRLQNAVAEDSLFGCLQKVIFLGSLTDFTVICQGKSFPTYKLILGARSEVFRAMFEPGHQFLEVTKNQVVMNDVTPESMEVFLGYLTSDKISLQQLRIHFSNLIHLAEKYQVQPLKKICRNFVMTSVSEENCIAIIYLSCVFNDDEVLTAAISVLVKAKDELLATEDWRNLERERPQDITRVLSAVLKML